MEVFERFVYILIGVAFICSASLGMVLYYHFARFSPDKNMTALTLSVYGGGLVGIAAFVALVKFYT